MENSWSGRWYDDKILQFLSRNKINEGVKISKGHKLPIYTNDKELQDHLICL